CCHIPRLHRSNSRLQSFHDQNLNSNGGSYPQRHQVLHLVIGQACFDAFFQLLGWNSFIKAKYNRPVSFVLKGTVENGSESTDKPGCTLKIHCILVRRPFLPVHSQSTSLPGYKARLTPLQSFLQLV